MATITITNLTFCYEGSYDNIFEDVSLQIDTNWKLGLIGRNGRGKTTFLRLLQKKLEYRGTISSPVIFDYFPFNIVNQNLLAIDIAESLIPDLEVWRLHKEISLLELDSEVLYRPFDTLSSGEQTKLLLAILFLRENHFLLIDEPTNHLDDRTRKVVGKYLGMKRGFILVSHDRWLLDVCVDHILSINRANIELQKGNFSSWQENRYRQDQFEQIQNKKLKKEVSRLSAAAKAAAGWSHQVEASKYGSGPVDRGYLGHRSAKMMKRAKTLETRRQNALVEKAKLLKNVESTEELLLHPMTFGKRCMVEARNLSLFYGEQPVTRSLNFTVQQGDRIALTGKNGSGKSTFLQYLLGRDIVHTGTLTVACGLKISYIPQDSSFLQGSLNEFMQREQLDETLFMAILRKLAFSRNQFEKRMEDYSEGQKKKVLLARSLCSQAHLYLWDEPLNYIDIISRVQIEDAILRCKPTLLFVEHDETFRQKIATKTIRFQGNHPKKQ